MNKEQQLVLELCRFVQPDGEKIKRLLDGKPDMPVVLGHLVYNRMGGAAYGVLRDTGLLGEVNREFRNTLQIVYDSYVTRTQSFQTALSRLSVPLSTLKIPYALLKGAFLAYRYPPGYRTSNDVDILVEPRHISELTDCLTKAGFRQGYLRGGVFAPATRQEVIAARLTRGETVPFVKEINLPGLRYLEIDINFSLDYQNAGSRCVAELLREPLWLPTRAEPVRTLMREDFLLHLCAHLYKEATTWAWVEMGRDLSLYKFADLYLLLADWPDSGYEALARRVRKTGLEKETYEALAGTRELFGLDSPALNRFLNDIRPAGAACLRQVIRPETHTLYEHTMDITDWLFCPDRGHCLKEVAG